MHIAASLRIQYLRDCGLTLNEAKVAIDTRFYIDHSHIPEQISNVSQYAPWLLGDIDDGEEWFAFTFREQPPALISHK